MTREWLSWIDTNQLQLLSHSKDIKERSGRDGDVSMEQDLVMSNIDKTLSWLQRRVKEHIAVTELCLTPGNYISCTVESHILPKTSFMVGSSS